MFINFEKATNLEIVERFFQFLVALSENMNFMSFFIITL